MGDHGQPCQVRAGLREATCRTVNTRCWLAQLGHGERIVPKLTSNRTAAAERIYHWWFLSKGVLLASRMLIGEECSFGSGGAHPYPRNGWGYRRTCGLLRERQLHMTSASHCCPTHVQATRMRGFRRRAAKVGFSPKPWHLLSKGWQPFSTASHLQQVFSTSKRVGLWPKCHILMNTRSPVMFPPKSSARFPTWQARDASLNPEVLCPFSDDWTDSSIL